MVGGVPLPGGMGVQGTSPRKKFRKNCSKVVVSVVFLESVSNNLISTKVYLITVYTYVDRKSVFQPYLYSNINVS
jgi:hypothetical protein